mgnify:CR=1 FL=1
MKSHERIFTKVFESLKRTLYIDSTWRTYRKQVGIYIIAEDGFIGIGLLGFEIILFDWSDEDIGFGWSFCPECGQRIDWSDEE